MKILRYPNKSLTTKTDPVDVRDPKLQEYVEQMSKLLRDTPNGAALAANQVGIPLRLFVIKDDLATSYGIPTAIINPVLKRFGEGDVDFQEGCLSFPGMFFNIRRPEAVVCDFENMLGDRQSIMLEDFGARVFQHECEHLDGKVFIDNLDRVQRFQVYGKIIKRR